jgi:hypothetical protein
MVTRRTGWHEIYGKIWICGSCGRTKEIKDYLNDFGPYDDFIIFDDSDFEYNKVLGIKRFIKTSSEDGILTKHMLNAKSLMGNWIKNV